MNVKKLKEDLGLTQMDLARKIGVSLQTVQKWINGCSKPRRENLAKLEALPAIMQAELKKREARG